MYAVDRSQRLVCQEKLVDSLQKPGHLFIDAHANGTILHVYVCVFSVIANYTYRKTRYFDLGYPYPDPSSIAYTERTSYPRM